MSSFWRKLPKPFFVLAPMANVTDAAFRKIIAKHSRMGKKDGGPDVMWTEFVSADGLMSSGQERLLPDLDFSRSERPIVAQLFTGHPEAMRGAAALVRELGFDGLDINTGCPDRAVEKQGGGAAMIKDPENALRVVTAAREGFQGPVSVKTRIGYNKIEWDWLKKLLELRPQLPALTVHLRTRKEMSEVAAHWELMPEIVRMRDEIQSDIPTDEHTLILGNGDVASLAEAREKVKATGCDGIMIGRGLFGTPWFFEDTGKFRPVRGAAQDPHRSSEVTRKVVTSSEESRGHTRTPAERLAILLEHVKLFEKMYGDKKGERLKNFAVMKKHFKAYVSGWDGAKELRVKLMEAGSAKEVVKVIDEALRT